MKSVLWSAVPPLWMNGLATIYTQTKQKIVRTRLNGLINRLRAPLRTAVYSYMATLGVVLDTTIGGKKVTFDDDGWRLMATLYYLMWLKGNKGEGHLVRFDSDTMKQAHGLLPWLFDGARVPNPTTYDSQLSEYILRHLVPLQPASVLDKLSELLTITCGVNTYHAILDNTGVLPLYGVGGLAGTSPNPSLITPGTEVPAPAPPATPLVVTPMPADTSLLAVKPEDVQAVEPLAPPVVVNQHDVEPPVMIGSLNVAVWSLADWYAALQVAPLLAVLQIGLYRFNQQLPGLFGPAAQPVTPTPPESVLPATATAATPPSQPCCAVTAPAVTTAAA